MATLRGSRYAPKDIDRKELISMLAHASNRSRAVLEKLAKDTGARSETEVMNIINGVRKQFDTIPPPPNTPSVPNLPVPTTSQADVPTNTPQPKDEKLEVGDMFNRFLRLGCIFDNLMDVWCEYYEKSRFSNGFFNGYNRQMPRVTESEMAMFEIAYTNGIIDSFMIDDRRLGSGTTLDLLQPPTTPEILRDLDRSRRLDINSLSKVFNGKNSPPMEAQKESLSSREVCIVGYSTNSNKFSTDSAIEQCETHHWQICGVGTWLRLVNFLRKTKPEKFAQFRSSFDAAPNLNYPKIIFNTYDENDHIYVGNIEPDSSSKKTTTIKYIRPSMVPSYNASPFVIVSS